MSEPLRIALVGATGLIGSELIARCVGRADVRLLAIARRETNLPPGACMELVVADPAQWGEIIARLRPDVLVSALGTTWKQAGKDEAEFRAVDEGLVLSVARAAQSAGVERMIAVSSTGADAASRTLYLRVKGEVERELMKCGFKRLDILQPGLLRGNRQGDRRAAERLGILLSPLSDLFLHGKLRKYRSIAARDVADAVLALAHRRAAGKFAHDNDAIWRAAHALPQLQHG